MGCVQPTDSKKKGLGKLHRFNFSLYTGRNFKRS